MSLLYFLSFFFLFFLVSPHSFSIKSSLITENSIANGISIALLSSSTNRYMDKNFIPNIDYSDPNPEFFKVNAWEIPWKYNASGEKQSGELQLQSITTGLWVMALNGGGNKVTVPSKNAYGWESFVYEKNGTEELLLKKNNYYFRIVNNEVWADTNDSSLAERFIIKKITERVEPNIYGVNLGGWLVTEKWMTPSIYGTKNSECEYEYCHSVGTQTCENSFNTHFSTFFNLSIDLQNMKSKGIFFC